MKTRLKIVLDFGVGMRYITSMKTLNEFMADCLHILVIDRPVDFKLGPLENEDWDAAYWDQGRRHVVRVSEHTTRCRLSLIAHELVHAAMMEWHPNHTADHGRKFRNLANHLQDMLEGIGWEFKDRIYKKGVDL